TYPFFLLVFIFVFFVATSLVEFMYARRIVRRTGLQVRRGAVVRGVLLANLVSYLILGPVYFYTSYPRTDVREFVPHGEWSKRADLPILAVAEHGQLVAATVGGQSNRVLVPYEVNDYVVSADLARVLFRGADDR